MSSRYREKRVAVLGGGISGLSAARLLCRLGSEVVLLDERSSVDDRGWGAESGFEVRCGVDELPEDEFELGVVSPAFAMEHRWVVELGRRGVELVSELELGAEYWQGRMIAVTGSKGKSSLVKLCSDTLNAAGVSASPAGNYGIPLSQLVVERGELEWAVVEVSSFQMEHTGRFAPEVAVLLNIQEDHLDRHRDMAEYSGLKLRLFRQLAGGGVALLPQGVALESGLIPDGVGVERFGGRGAEWSYGGGRVVGGGRWEGVQFKVGGSWFDNEVLGLAAAAGCAALSHAGLGVAEIEAGLHGFEPLAHRMQLVGVSREGVSYINDSKATSLAAVGAALRMVKRPARVVAGGVLKERGLESLKELLTDTTKKVYLIGSSSRQMYEAWSPVVSCEECGTLEQAVERAVGESQPGECVLLSPGTASFDQFNSYQDRGERFMALVRKVAEL